MSPHDMSETELAEGIREALVKAGAGEFTVAIGAEWARTRSKALWKHMVGVLLVTGTGHTVSLPEVLGRSPGEPGKPSPVDELWQNPSTPEEFLAAMDQFLIDKGTSLCGYLKGELSPIRRLFAVWCGKRLDIRRGRG